jgi:chemotaxis response regulator CheB
MIVLCVARHLYLAQHLARVLAQAGAGTRSAVGFAEARALAVDCNPDVIVADYDMLATLPSDAWENDLVLSCRPVIAVSLTRRSGEANALDKNGVGGHLYLPEVGAPMVLRMLRAAADAAGVRAPNGALTWPARGTPSTAS